MKRGLNVANAGALQVLDKDTARGNGHHLKPPALQLEAELHNMSLGTAQIQAHARNQNFVFSRGLRHQITLRFG